MFVVSWRGLAVLAACAWLASCSKSPTAPSAVGQGPLISQGPLVSLVPQEPPPVPPRISIGPPGVLSATRYLAFGDSLTYGVLSSFDGLFLYDVPTHSYPVRLRLALNTYHAAQTFSVVNAGMPGEWAADGAVRLPGVLSQNQPQVLVLLEGINDLANDQGISGTANAVARMIDAARQRNITVLVCTMPQTYTVTTPLGEVHDNAADRIRPYNAELQRVVSTRQNVYLVDLYRAFGTNRSLIGGDGLHPTEEGYQLMASTILQAIESVFSVRGSFQ